MRARLLNQLNQVLQTNDNDRGLVVNMRDVLFDSRQYTLKSGARERLARIAGIVTGYPELTFEIEAHIDATVAIFSTNHFLRSALPACAITSSVQEFK
jgi:outer membrane protein OmpA-like peptidoglycan-associated protein